jgi:hypothetical protein
MLIKSCVLMVMLGASSGLGCGSGFSPYNKLEDLRLLAVRAEPPWVAPGSSTVLDALVFEPDGQAVQYAWSWCPARGNTDNDFACLVSEAELATQLGLDPSLVSYDLGQAPTAELRYLGTPELLNAVCAGVRAQDATLFVPNCEHGFPVSVGLTISTAEAKIQAFKTVYLVVAPDRGTNQNPLLEAVWANKEGLGRDHADLVVEGTPSTLAYGETYDLFVDLPENAAETYVPAPTHLEPTPAARRESLIITWFVQAGETEAARTSYIEGEVKMDVLEHNQWTLPQPEEVDSSPAALILVVRDNRGGTSWLTRQIELVSPE